MITKKLSFMCLLALSSFFWTSCGEDEPQFIESFSYDVGDNSIALDFEFNSDLSVNTEFRVPILDYAFINMSPSNDSRGVIIGTELNLAAFYKFLEKDMLSLEKTRLLPNGQPMSSYVTSDVGRFRIEIPDTDGQVATSLYFGLQPEQFYLGTAIELGFLDEHFPAGLVISQRFRDHKQRPVCVVTLYGPKVENGTVLAPGGLFVITNVSQLIEYAEQDKIVEPESYLNAMNISSNNVLNVSDVLIPRQSIFLAPVTKTEVNLSAYDRKDKLYQVFQLYKQKGRESGMMN